MPQPFSSIAIKQTGPLFKEAIEEKRKQLELHLTEDYGLLETIKDLHHEPGNSSPVHLHFKEEDEDVNEENVMRSPSSGRM